MRALYLFVRHKYVEHLQFFAHVHRLFFLVAFVTLLAWQPVRFARVLAWPARTVTLCTLFGIGTIIITPLTAWGPISAAAVGEAQ